MSAAAAPRPRVLVCDDSPTIRSVVQLLLGGSHECLLVASGEEALEKAPAFGPDLILSDVLMEGMSGYELCRRIREDPAYALVPMILLTSKADEESRAAGLELGADDFLFKPIRPRELLARVGSLLRLRQANLALAERSRELEAANRTLQEAQAALVQSEKMATVGTMVSGIAHEINNPLAFMKSGAASVKSLVDELAELAEAPLAAAGGDVRGRFEETTAEIREVAQELTEGTLRLQKIVASLKMFSTSGGEQFEETDLAAEIDRAWSLAAMKCRGAHRFEKAVDELPAIRTVPHLVGQVLLNVFINAAQATEGKGTIRVAARRLGGEAVITVADEGPGIPAQHLTRIFDPFFTTKKPGQGTGLGLSVSYGIMRSLGGRIEACSPPGGGATFTIALPLQAPVAAGGGATYNELRSRYSTG